MRVTRVTDIGSIAGSPLSGHSGGATLSGHRKFCTRV